MVINPTLNTTVGAALLGGFATSMLYGIVCSQCYTFFQSPNQRHTAVIIKYPIAILSVLITLYTGLVLHSLYWYAVINFGNESKVLDITWSIRALVVVAAVNDVIVRSCFVHRAWILGGHRTSQWYIFPLVFLVLCLFGVSMTVGVWSLKLKTLQDFQSIEALYNANLIMVAVADLTIAGRLTFLLASMKGNFIKRTDSLINIMLAYTINTGLITSLVSIASLIAHATMPYNYVFLAVFFPLSPLYVNALLASYNARYWLRSESPPGDGDKLPHNDGSLHVRVIVESQETY
ncbi:uncharacterized protein PHACADRAFT_260594 [Phanerochaete carnosa HHB-10118-sp]|uniref:DUF6534 domain-containing protein n=1 Tax=Phanerochaete carnosa (strain HHB-10118-sp) TaxID=650164 RepID=K5VLL5_PHACS|nr:uncharacterized protein PHACADRAFT_260594 [Phanerochaete carnosa HHB-10118-sp]EKM52288.1 hypothetical protein PHACADRAFT_260594 [Phanerochaete carnosa HHB-10118-sp]